MQCYYFSDVRKKKSRDLSGRHTIEVEFGEHALAGKALVNSRPKIKIHVSTVYLREIGKSSAPRPLARPAAPFSRALSLHPFFISSFMVYLFWFGSGSMHGGRIEYTSAPPRLCGTEVSVHAKPAALVAIAAAGVSLGCMIDRHK